MPSTTTWLSTSSPSTPPVVRPILAPNATRGCAWDCFVEAAQRLGLSRVATGHYARMIGMPPRLARGVDPQKDQSYVLAEVAPDILEHVLFPLGEMRKPEVREMAAQAGLEGHSAPESQEICFVPDDDHRRFLRERLGDLPRRHRRHRRANPWAPRRHLQLHHRAAQGIAGGGGRSSLCGGDRRPSTAASSSALPGRPR